MVTKKYTVVTLRGTCNDERVCPAVHKILEEPHLKYVQGRIVDDPEKLAAFDLPLGEGVLAVPSELLAEVE